MADSAVNLLSDFGNGCSSSSVSANFRRNNASGSREKGPRYADDLVNKILIDDGGCESKLRKDDFIAKVESTLPLTSEEELLLDLACSAVASTLAPGKEGELGDFFLRDLFAELEEERAGVKDAVRNSWRGVDSDDEDERTAASAAAVEDELCLGCQDVRIALPSSSSSLSEEPMKVRNSCAPGISTFAADAPCAVNGSTLHTSLEKRSSSAASDVFCDGVSYLEEAPPTAAFEKLTSNNKTPPTIGDRVAEVDSPSITTDLSIENNRSPCQTYATAWEEGESFGADDDSDNRTGIAGGVPSTTVVATSTVCKLAEIDALSSATSAVVSPSIESVKTHSSATKDPLLDNQPTTKVDKLGIMSKPITSPAAVRLTSVQMPPPALCVPVKVLNEAKLFQSAKISENRRKTGGVSSSITKLRCSSKKKKKNEFGKRRRSSGGGDACPPNLIDLGSSIDGLLVEQDGEVGGSGGGKEEGVEEEGGRKEKLDPLKYVKDARLMAKQPLILQWLMSDGFDVGDAEAAGALNKSLGSLAAIHDHYWGGGG